MARAQLIIEHLVYTLKSNQHFMCGRTCGVFSSRKVVNGREIHTTRGRDPKITVKHGRAAAIKALANLDKDPQAIASRLAVPQPRVLELSSIVAQLARVEDILLSIKPEEAPVANPRTFVEVVAQLDTVYFAENAPNTTRAYRNYLANALLPEWGDIPVESITSEDVQDWTVNYVGANGGKLVQPFKVFKPIMNLALERRLVAKIPVCATTGERSHSLCTLHTEN